jgi:hypothetical protein
VRADWKKSCELRVVTMPATMKATVSAASAARRARVRSSARVSMICVLFLLLSRYRYHMISEYQLLS